MKVLNYIIIGVLLTLIAVMFVDRVTDADKYEDLKLQTLQKLDSVRAHYRQLIAEDSITFIHYQRERMETERMKLEAKIWQTRYEREKNKPVRRYTDSQLDSIMGTIR